MARLQGEGVEVDEVSVGATPTCGVDVGGEVVTEWHPGNYLLLDRQQVATGVVDISRVAGTVLGRVIGHYPDRSQPLITIDVGALALSKDSCPQGGFGQVLDEPHLVVSAISQEVGKIPVTSPADWDAHPVGSFVRIIPNHACLAAACFQEYILVRGNAIQGRCTPCRGW
mmetsp:Transcript_2446/g.5092  ORF Transcript_2446/g.5092 Transcript_2446/m.5092 type:complete len:170 (-) Transcript_2446:390-899(-)